MYYRSLSKAGYNVEWVMSGDDAYAMVTSKTYDLLLLDIMLPESPGTEILAKLRSPEQDMIPNTRVVILTNFDQDDSTRAEIEKLVDGYLIKADITPRKLLAIIASMQKVGPSAPQSQE